MHIARVKFNMGVPVAFQLALNKTTYLHPITNPTHPNSGWGSGCTLIIRAAGCTPMVGSAGCTLTIGAAGHDLVGAGGVLGLRSHGSGYALAAWATCLLAAWALGDLILPGKLKCNIFPLGGKTHCTFDCNT
jgi:hypothetical protein